MIWDDDDYMTTTELTPKEVSRELRRLSVIVDRVHKYLFGNGEKGFDETLRETTARQINIAAALDKLSDSFEEYKLKQDEVVKKVNPKQEELSTSDKILKWFGDKVLPGLVTGLITTIITIITVLTVLHWTEIFK